MPGGTKGKLHFHSNARQFFYILSGNAAFFIDNKIEIARPQQGLLIQPKTKHYIANETNDWLDYLVISQPTTNNDRTTIEN